jgi:NADH-quinone oxidoreductase subunit G
MSDEITLSINGKEITAAKGQLVIDAAERHGVYIPRFCYHPRMQPVGMCRMCIVDIDTGRGPALQPACMISVVDGMKVDTQSDATKKAQDGVLEFLLVNHPLDCPVCDKGGECPLQDQTLAYGPGESRFVEEKRHFEKPIPISDLVYLDRERCILCDRCTRFAKDVGGDPLIHFLNRGDQTEVNTFPDHPFASYFSGNTVQICPVGALTAKPYRFKARPWDLEQTESTCTSCSVGCRIVIQSSRNRVLRYLGVDIDPVNWSWLCDKGRFDFEYVSHDDRLARPLVRARGELVPASWGQALDAAASAIRNASNPEAIAFLGGARLTNEAAYVWSKFAKGVVGTDNVDAQFGDGLPAELVLGLPRATIDDVCAAGGTVLLLAPDLKEELPVLYLRLRDAVAHHGATVVELSPVPTGLTPYASASLRYRPGEAASVLRAVFGHGDATALEGDITGASARLSPDRPLTVVVGRASLAESADSTVDAVSVVLAERPGARFLPVLRRANVHGALDMGLAPGVLPGRVSLDAGREWYTARWPGVPAAAGLDARGILEAAASGRIDTLVLIGADPLTAYPDRNLVARALVGARAVVSVATFLDASAQQADVVLAAAGYAETAGTTTNIEGRVSTLSQRVTPPGTARPDWVLATELASRMGVDLGVESVEDVWDEIERTVPSHRGITRAVLYSSAGADGVVAPLAPDADLGGTPVSIDGLAVPAGANDPAAPGGSEPGQDAGDAPISGEAPDAEPAPAAAGDGAPAPLAFAPAAPADVPAVDSYSLRLVATRSLYDGGTLVQHSPSLAGLAPASALRLNPYDFDRLGVSSGRATVTSPRGTVTSDVVADSRVPRGVAALLVAQHGTDPFELIDAAALVNDVRVESQ